MGIVELIALAAGLAPKIIDAGQSVVDLWRAAGRIIADAEKTWKVGGNAALRLKT